MYSARGLRKKVASSNYREGHLLFRSVVGEDRGLVSSGSRLVARCSKTGVVSLLVSICLDVKKAHSTCDDDKPGQYVKPIMHSISKTKNGFQPWKIIIV